MTMQPLSSYLTRNADTFASKPALIDGATILSHREVLDRVAMLAATLRAQAQRGRVMIVLPSGHEVILAHYAALLAGTEAMLVDAHAPADEVAQSLATFGPDVLLTTQHDTVRLADAAPSLRRVIALPSEAAPTELPRAVVGTVSWTDPVPPLEDHSSLDASCVVLGTTGTTGARKQVSLSQRNVLAAARNINEYMGTNESAREVTPLPLHRSFGLGRARCLTLVGGTLIVSPARGDRALALVAQHQANGFSSVPAFLRMLIKTFGRRLERYWGALEYIEIGSAPMDRADKQFLLAVAPKARICMHYGLTEASRSAFIDFRAEADRLDTVGRAAPHVSIAVVDSSGAPCPPGAVGEIVIRGDHVCREYWQNPALTAARLRNGWLHTNDCGSVDADGYLRLAGRLDDVINVGGAKVSPERIEDVARALPGIADCAAIGVADPSGVYGEVPVLYVVGEGLSPQRVKAHCMAHLRPEEVPRDIRFVAAIPRTDTGKIQRAQLRARAA